MSGPLRVPVRGSSGVRLLPWSLSTYRVCRSNDGVTCCGAAPADEAQTYPHPDAPGVRTRRAQCAAVADAPVARPNERDPILRDRAAVAPADDHHLAADADGRAVGDGLRERADLCHPRG